MASSPSILYCHCAYAKILPDDRKQAVRAGLAASGAPHVAVADLCELAATHDATITQFARAAGPLHIVACHPRAVRWLFAAAGAPLPATAVVHNMRTQDAATILGELKPGRVPLAACSQCDQQQAPSGKPPVAPDQQSSPVPDFPAKEEGDWIPWFPVIDRDRCVNCRQCVEFCLFGTYATDTDGKVRVVHPEKCKTNCPACARVCPYTAIIFPKFTDGPISGDEGRLSGSAESGVAGDMGGLSKANIQTLLKRRDAARARAAAGGPAQGDAPASSRSRLGTAPASCDAPAPTSPFNPQSAIHNPQSPEEPPAR